MTTHGLLFLRIVTGFPILFTSAVTREKLFFASARPIVSVDIPLLSTLAKVMARIWPQIKQCKTVATPSTRGGNIAATITNFQTK